MIFLKLFLTFLKIGLFSFGGGLAMIALIQNEVVVKNSWMSAQEFTDVVATSQITPGPVGINTATYAGYTAVVNSGYAQGWGVVGALIASFAVILLPLLLMLLVSQFLLKNKQNPLIASMLAILRLSVVGLIAAAALLMVTPETFGTLSGNPTQFCFSVCLFITVFVAAFRFKISPILLILLSGLAGFVIYGLVL